MTSYVRRIISGGQTGADRAALDVARELGIPHGGWVPKGRRAEDGPIDPRYHLTELPDGTYEARTQANVLSSDATLIVSVGPLAGGSALTLRLAEKHGKPLRHIDLSKTGHYEAVGNIRRWLADVSPNVLNVAGPREPAGGGVYQPVRELLLEVFRNAAGKPIAR